MDNNEYISKQKVEKWTTKEKFNALGDLRDIEPGTEYNLTGAIEEGELDSALQTKINGKLDKPTTPTAESAVVLGTDGTASTKPLSEIGGKSYRHYINLAVNVGDIIYEFYFSLYSDYRLSYTSFSTLPRSSNKINAAITGRISGSVYITIDFRNDSPVLDVEGVIHDRSDNNIKFLDTSFSNDVIFYFVDTVTEL